MVFIYVTFMQTKHKEIEAVMMLCALYAYIVNIIQSDSLAKPNNEGPDGCSDL